MSSAFNLTRAGGLTRWVILALTLITVMVAAVSVGASPVEAYDGPYSPCKVESWPTNYHCYAIDEWSMVDGKSSGVNGLTAYIEPSQAYVPGWKKDNFVTQEMWTAFHDLSGGCAWSEIGVITGDEYNETTDRPFLAWDNGCGSQYFSGQVFIPDLSIGYGNYFWVESLYYGPGKWEQWIEGAGPFDTGAEMPGGADNPEIGLEETNTNIVANGNSINTVWEAPSGVWQDEWYDPYSFAERSTPGVDGQDTAPTCATPNTGEPGNVSWVSYADSSVSCFYGDNGDYEDVLPTELTETSPVTGSSEVPSAIPVATPANQRPVRASDWQTLTAVQDEPLLSKSKLRSKALRFAAANGDPAPTEVEAVKTGLRAALKAADSKMTLPEANTSDAVWAAPLAAALTSEVDIVTMRGQFASNMSVPEGDIGPTGTVLELVLDAHTGAVDASFLGSQEPSTSLEQLGTLEKLG